MMTSALAQAVLESELFGHEKGAYTGAERRRIGRFEHAHDGTIFLDEIGELSPSTQIKLLTVLQDRTFERVGGSDPIRVDVRILAATNHDLAADVAGGRFRNDLYYRLNVIAVDLPPLRARGSDVILLAEHLLRRFALENHKSIAGFSERAMTKICSHRWPGNVRELENAIERAAVLCPGGPVGEDHLSQGRASPTGLEGMDTVAWYICCRGPTTRRVLTSSGLVRSFMLAPWSGPTCRRAVQDAVQALFQTE